VLSVVFDSSGPPPRAPPVQAPLDACPGAGASNSGRADPVVLAPPGADEATRRASLLSEARACASTFVLDPLLRPD
jgi:hypothetical protein